MSGVEVDYAAVQGRREKVVSTLIGGVGGLFKKNGIDLIEGEQRGAASAETATLVDRKWGRRRVETRKKAMPRACTWGTAN